jgi:SNF2 family DNA or RNA helicase
VVSTGTPVPNRVENAYGIVSLVSPGAYHSRRAFDITHVVRKALYLPGQLDAYGRQRSIQVVDHYIDLDRLSENIYRRGIYVDQCEEIRLDAPNIQIVECNLTPPHRKLYKEVLRTRIVELGDGEVIDATSAQKLRQTALQLISCPEQYGGKPSHNSLYETLEELLGTFEGKITVFANFTRTVELLKDRFKAWHPVTVYGPNGSTRNAQNVEIFKTDPNCRMLIANPVSGGTGFTLGEVCTTIIFAEPVSSPGDFEQCLSRVLLVGQKEPVMCYIIKPVNTISALAIDHMTGKARDITEVMRSKDSIFKVLFDEKTDSCD